ncbi:MAG: glycosyltransferase [Candidatus Helarchaeota archaeon]|nr:glycosyltransferase [Candidatus Helarchaeota archaeon]
MKISVIIPTYNSEQTISECLGSLSTQTYSPYEIIIVDRKSVDLTVEKVKEFEGVRLILKEFPVLKGAVRNRGAGIAVGDIIFFCDADCIVDQRALEYHLKSYKSRKDISGVMGGIRNASSKTFVSVFVQKEEMANQWLRGLNPDGSCKIFGNTNFSMYRSDFLKWKYREDLVAAEDTELSLRISKEVKIIFEPKAIVFHHHPTTVQALFKQRKWWGEGIFGLIRYCKREVFDPDSRAYSVWRYLDYPEDHLHEAIFQDNQLLCDGCRAQICKIDTPRLPKHGESDEYLCRVICLGFASGILKQRTGIDYYW